MKNSPVLMSLERKCRRFRIIGLASQHLFIAHLASCGQLVPKYYPKTRLTRLSLSFNIQKITTPTYIHSKKSIHVCSPDNLALLDPGFLRIFTIFRRNNLTKYLLYTHTNILVFLIQETRQESNELCSRS